MNRVFVLASVLLAAAAHAGESFASHADAALSAAHFSGVVLFARKDQVLFEKAYGMANREHQVPNQLETVFPYCSITKQFTAAVALQTLASRGKTPALSLGEVFGTDARGKPWASLPLSALLTHASGLGLPDDVPEPSGEKTPVDQVSWFYREEAPSRESAQSAAAYLLARPADGKRGSFRYNNGDFIIASAALERLTHERYADLLGAALTRWHLGSLRALTSSAIVPHLAQDYLEGSPATRGPPVRWENYGAAANLAGTARDLFRWARVLLTDPGLTPAQRHLLFDADPLTHFTTFGSFTYRLGSQPAVHVVEREGAVGGYRTLLLLAPEPEVVMVFLSNSDGFDNSGTYQGHGMPWALLKELVGK